MFLQLTRMASYSEIKINNKPNIQKNTEISFYDDDFFSNKLFKILHKSPSNNLH